MKRILSIVLILTFLTCIGNAAEPKISPNAINWSKDIGSQIHGVWNATSDGDLITYNQTPLLAGRAGGQTVIGGTGIDHC